MEYFEKHYRELGFPISREGSSGFRPAQIAAAQSVASHFFNSNLPAIVTMPTGAGKTTVLMACAFMLRAKRVLIITPSRLVREQIAENFGALNGAECRDYRGISLTMWQKPNCVAVWAVRNEPVSDAGYPVYQGKYREFCIFYNPN